MVTDLQAEQEAMTVSNEDHRTFDLHRTPAELRNRIYEFVVIEEDQINIRKPRPAITQVCRQTRKESLPIYFGKNVFLVLVFHKNFSYISKWLDVLQDEHKKSLKNLAVLCCGRLLKGMFADSIEPNFDVWRPLIATLANSGLQPWQVSWPTQVSCGDNYKSFVFDRQPFWIGQVAEKLLFTKYVLSPLLRHFSFWDASKPPPDPIKQVQEGYDRGKGKKHPIDSHLSRARHEVANLQPARWWKEYRTQELLERAYLQENLNGAEKAIEEYERWHGDELSVRDGLLEDVVEGIAEAREKGMSIEDVIREKCPELIEDEGGYGQ